MIDNLSFDSALHGLIPCSKTFAIKFVQNCLCPLSSVSEYIIKGKQSFRLDCHHLDFGSFLRFITVSA